MRTAPSCVLNEAVLEAMAQPLEWLDNGNVQEEENVQQGRGAVEGNWGGGGAQGSG